MKIRIRRTATPPKVGLGLDVVGPQPKAALRPEQTARRPRPAQPARSASKAQPARPATLAPPPRPARAPLLKVNTAKLAEMIGSSEEGDAIDVVGGDGKLNKVPKHSTWATPTGFPTLLKVVNGTTSITLDSTGITMADTAGSGKSLTITFAALLAGKTISLRVDDYCDGTTNKSQQHLATAPYT